MLYTFIPTRKYSPRGDKIIVSAKFKDKNNGENGGDKNFLCNTNTIKFLGRKKDIGSFQLIQNWFR